MPNLTSVTYTSGSLDAATTGTVSTVDNLENLTQKTKVIDSAGTNALAVDTHGSLQATITDSAGTEVTFNQSVTADYAKASGASPVMPPKDWIYNVGYYVVCAANATTTLQSSTGAAGDYLHQVVVYPVTTAAGTVTIKDGATTIATYAGGGTTALLTLTPFVIPVGAYSRSGAWSVVTGNANVAAAATGRFS